MRCGDALRRCEVLLSCPSDPGPGTAHTYMYLAIRPSIWHRQDQECVCYMVYTQDLSSIGNMTPSTLCGESTRLASSAAVVLDK
jgi:hypothetical protein